jgi:tight adherence protein B
VGLALPILVAGVGGAALALALAELLGSIPFVRRYVGSATAALVRTRREGRFPTVIERRRLGVLTGAALALLTLTVAGPGPAAALAGLGPWLAGQLISRGAHRYRLGLEAAVPEIARGLADGIGSGGSLRRGLIDLAPTLEGPAATELGRVCADLRLGVPPRAALAAMAARCDSPEIVELIAAVGSQERSGGDLVGLLRRLGESAEARGRVRAEARSATAQARLTGGMVVAMPAAVGLLIELVAPGFLGGLVSDPLAAVLVAVAVGLQLCAWVVIQRLGRVKP